jgi:tetratricopeptide (TPR) repeat protein
MRRDRRALTLIILILAMLACGVPSFLTGEGSESIETPAVIEGAGEQADVEADEGADAASVEALIAQGNDLGEQGEFDAAIDLYTQAIERDPTSVDAFSRRGSVYFMIGDMDSAAADYTRAIELDPEEEIYYLFRAFALEEVDVAAALDDYIQFFANHPEEDEYSDAARTQIIALSTDLAYEDPAAAVDILTRAIEIDPEFVAAHFARSAVQASLGNFDDALPDISRAIELEPGNAGFHSHQGSIYMEMDDLESAVDAYTHAIDLDPRDAESYFWRAMAYVGLRDNDSALPDLDRAIELDPSYDLAYHLRASIHYEAYNDEAAIADYTQFLMLHPENDDLAADARERIEGMGGTVPEPGALTAEELIDSGFEYLGQGDLEAAVDAFTRAIPLASNPAEGYVYRGYAYAMADDLEAAIDDFSMAIELAPDIAISYHMRCRAYREMDRLDSALEDCNRAIELDPQWAGAYVTRGMIHDDLGNIDEALADYTQFLMLDPEGDEDIAIARARIEALGGEVP